MSALAVDGHPLQVDLFRPRDLEYFVDPQKGPRLAVTNTAGGPFDQRGAYLYDDAGELVKRVTFGANGSVRPMNGLAP